MILHNNKKTTMEELIMNFYSIKNSKNKTMELSRCFDLFLFFNTNL